MTEKYLEEIRSKLKTDDVVIQLTEECCELSQALMKYLRLYSANPPKADEYDVLNNIREEIADVELALEQLPSDLNNREAVNTWKEYKIERWVKRLNGDWENER